MLQLRGTQGMGTPMGAAKRIQTLWVLQATGGCVHPQAEVAKSDNHLSQVTITRVLHKALKFTVFWLFHLIKPPNIFPTPMPL